MSIHVLSWVLRHSEAQLGARLVLISLADHAKDDGTCAWPSVDTIAREARLSRSAVQRNLRTLEADGAITERGHSKVGTAIYDVTMGGPQNAAGGAASRSGGGRAARPEPSKEPSVPSPEQQNKGSKVDGKDFTMQLDVHVPEVPKREPKEVDGKLVTLPEHEMADVVLDAFSNYTDGQFASKEWRAKIVRRCREHPEIDIREHIQVIARNFAVPWWTGAATPSVIYGSAEQFERAMACDGKPRGSRQRKSYERDPELLKRQARAMVGVKKRRSA